MQPLNQWTDSITDNEQKAYKKEHQSEYLYRLQEIKRTGATTVNLLALVEAGLVDAREGANKRGNSSRLTQSFHFFMFEPIFSPVNALNQPI
ncbi:hypothetical protein [Aeromonas hydrophila]|uniref:hypothetical protein n=1 Tax=Aeromonas hydrophila TaxID=644 RepID=UPI0038D0B536